MQSAQQPAFLGLPSVGSWLKVRATHDGSRFGAPQTQVDTVKHKLDANAAPPCTKCKNKMEWSNFSEGAYKEGWHCDNFATCKNQATTPGQTRYRWFCKSCGTDLCSVCFPKTEPKCYPLQPNYRGDSRVMPTGWDKIYSRFPGPKVVKATTTVASTSQAILSGDAPKPMLLPGMDSIYARFPKYVEHAPGASGSPKAAEGAKIPIPQSTNGSNDPHALSFKDKMALFERGGNSPMKKKSSGDLKAAQTGMNEESIGA